MISTPPGSDGYLTGGAADFIKRQTKRYADLVSFSDVKAQ